MNSKSLVLILLSFFIFNSIHADITWSFSNNKLTISGTDMPNYYDGPLGDSTVPWNNVIGKIYELVIEDGVTNIGDYAFSRCNNLRSVTIPNSVTSIGSCAFIACSRLRSVTIPNSVTSIGESAFRTCGITSVTIPTSVNSIGEYAFYLCNALTSVTIPNSLTAIPRYTFGCCYALTSVKIPETITSIGEYAFSDCRELTSIIVEKGNLKYDSRNDCNAIIETHSNTLIAGCKNTIIPNTVTSIGEGGFSGCNFTSIFIPNSVMAIGNSVFYGCKGLTSITIPNSVTSIGDYVFYNCSELTSITISNSVTSIGDDVFYGCKGLTSITIPNSVTSIGNQAFGGCKGLTSITCKASTPPNCSGSPFADVNKSIPLYVPGNSLKEYRTNVDWIDFENIQAIPSTSVFFTDGDSYTNNSQSEECDISYTRTFNNTKWQALYIPFSISYDDWRDDFDVAYINGVRQLDTNDDNVIDETIMDVYRIESGSLIPNTPYLIKAKTTGEKTISISNATLYPAEENSIDCSTTIAKYTFTGTYSTIPAATLIENEYYAMGGGSIIMTDGTSDLKPYRWYMKIEARSPMYNVANAAKAITIRVMGEENETTGISQLQMPDDELSVYDLNGRRVDENALKPGLYIKSGKKVVIK